MKDKKYKCPHCNKEFGKYGIKTHIWRMHGEGKSFDPNKGYKDGSRKAWNKGLTKETNTIILNESIKLSNKLKQQAIDGTLKGCCSKQFHGTKEHLEWSAKGGGYRKNLGRGKQGSYKGYWCDSSWELAFVIYHLEHNIQFKKNWKKFPYIFNGKNHTYLPDFIYPDKTYIEVKGYFDDRSITKALQFKHKIKILREKEIRPYLNYVEKKYGKDFIQLYEKGN